jgi:hypothetical protein
MSTIKPVLIDDSGKTFLLEVSNRNYYSIGMESEKDNNALKEFDDAENAAKTFLRILEKSKYVKYKIDENTYIQIDNDFTIKSLVEKLVEISNMEMLLKSKTFFRTSISNFTKILINIILMNNKYNQSFIEYVYNDLQLVNNNTILSLLKATINNIIEKIDQKLNKRYELSLYSILSGYDVERKGYYYDYDYLKKIIHVYLSFRKKCESEGVYSYSHRDTNLQNICEELLFGNYNKLIEDQELLDIVSRTIDERNISNLEDIREKITNKAFLNIIELLKKNSYITRNHLFVLEIYRRKLNSIVDINMINDIRLYFFGKLASLPKWPSEYINEIKLIIKDIFIDIDDSEFERMFSIIEKYSNVFTKEQIFKFLFEENFDLIVNDNLLKGKSREYFKEVIRVKIIGTDFKHRDVFSDKHSYLMRDNIKDSIYLKMNMAMNVMSNSGNLYSDDLISEIFRELFKAIIPATKSEREKVTEMISYFIHHDKYSDNFDNVNTNKIKIMLEQMSNSNLKNVTIERMIDKGNYETWIYSRGSRGRKMFGLDYVDVLNIIQGLPLRNIFAGTILKIQLN